ncbi:MAG: ParB N-terminal domain-containing protein [Planctomycetaceae bacterium]
MNLRRLPLSALIPAPYNPRLPLEPGSPGYERLARSLREFDLVQPVVWNERTGHVVAGHQRVEVLKREGTAEVDVVVVDLPLAREKALNVALNNTQVGSDWDPAKLVDVMAELNDLPDFDATLTGFDAADINDLLLAPAPDMATDDLDDEDERDLVRMTIEIPPEDWDDVRPDLDTVIAQHDLTVHIQMPQSETGRG